MRTATIQRLVPCANSSMRPERSSKASSSDLSRRPISSDRTVSSRSCNRSPTEGPLMDHIKAFIEREDPGAEVVPSGLPGFSDSNWFRTAFPDCVAYGFMPAREFDLFQAMPLIHGADERVPGSRGEPEIDAVGDAQRAEAFAELLCLESACNHWSTMPRMPPRAKSTTTMSSRPMPRYQYSGYCLAR